MKKTSCFILSLSLTAIALAQSGPAQPVTVTTISAAAAAQSPGSVTSTAQAVAATTIAPAVLPDRVVAPVGTVEQTTGGGETSLTLDVSNGIRFVPPSRVTIPSGDTLRITGPNYGSIAQQWYKNNQPIPGATSRSLVLTSLTSADAGTYGLGVTDPAATVLPSQSLILGVGPTDRLANISTRGTIAAGAGQSYTVGFVVSGAATQAKKLILRAVGPSLTSFGVSNPLRAPILRIYDSAGKPYTNGFVYPAVVGGPTYESDLAESLARTGAFPIPGGTLDAVVMMPFTPGAYTAQVTSGDNTAGTVLVEVYEVP